MYSLQFDPITGQWSPVQGPFTVDRLIRERKFLGGLCSSTSSVGSVRPAQSKLESSLISEYALENGKACDSCDLAMWSRKGVPPPCEERITAVLSFPYPGAVEPFQVEAEYKNETLRVGTFLEEVLLHQTDSQFVLGHSIQTDWKTQNTRLRPEAQRVL